MKRLWNKAFVNFINGIVILLPVAVTIVFVRFLILKINAIMLEPVMKLFVLVIKAPQHVYILVRSILFLFVLVSITFIGWGAKVLFIRKIFSFGESLFLKVPFMGKVYTVSKQIFSSFFGQGKTIFKQVVLVEYPRNGLYCIGFVTGRAKGEIETHIGKDIVNVFIPTTPNPTSGVFLFIPKESVRFLKMSVEDGMKLVISGGVVDLTKELV